MATERYHPLFAADLSNACSHYDSIADTLGDRFRVNVRLAIHAVVERPESFGRIGGEFRGALVNRFPYVVVFTIEGKVPTILTTQTRRLGYGRRWTKPLRGLKPEYC